MTKGTQEVTKQKEVAGEILKQLGGNRFVAMTGARDFFCGTNLDHNHFMVLSFKGSNVANKLMVTLNVMDTYNVDFYKVRGYNLNKVKVLENVYNTDLASIFESVTGLRTSL